VNLGFGWGFEGKMVWSLGDGMWVGEEGGGWILLAARLEALGI